MGAINWHINVAKEEKITIFLKYHKRGKNISCTTPSISRCSSGQGSTHHIVHATFNLGYDQCHLCHHHQKQLFREKMMHYSTNTYFVLLFLRLMPALAHPVDHSAQYAFCKVYFSAQPNKLRHILNFDKYYPIEHIFVPACSSARKIHFFKF